MNNENNPHNEITQNVENEELSNEELDKVSGGTKDSLKPADLSQLQRLMDQKGQLESMISNTLKANSDTQSGIASNLKAS